MPLSTITNAVALLALNTVLVASSPLAACASQIDNNQDLNLRGCNNDQLATTPPSTSDRFFRLKTVVHPNEPESATKRFNNEYVNVYHTGAGEGDLVLGGGSVFSIRDNKLVWTFFYGQPGEHSNDQQIPVNVVYEPYAGWEPVHASPRAENDGDVTSFFDPTNETLNMRWDAGPLYGFRVCDWWHGVPQVFANAAPEKPSPNNGYFNTTITTCADVDLVREFLNDP